MYPVIIGNMRGARRMLPDPDWKAEDQSGVRASTIGGNNDNDDDQGGDMLVRKVRRVLRRRETPRRNQPSPRRAQALLSVYDTRSSEEGFNSEEIF